MAKHSNAAKTGRPKGGKRKPTHPYIASHPNFPLSFHKGTGRFYKTFKGRRYYFGDQPVKAKHRFDREWSYIVRGEAVPEDDGTVGGLLVGELFDKWLAYYDEEVQDSKLQQSTYDEYERIGGYAVDKLGSDRAVSSLCPQDFTDLLRAVRRKTSAPSSIKKHVAVTRMLFGWGFDEELSPAVSYGKRFKAPSAADFEAARFERGRQIYTAEEVRSIIDAANPTLRAAVLLGVNGGYSQKEVSELRKSWLDADTSVLDHLRGKTKAPRRVPLWDETLEAIEAMPKHSPKRGARGLLFVTREGKPYHQDHPVRIDGIGQMFDRITEKLGINLDQSGFGKLRATHRTASDGVIDDKACKIVMGHRLGGTDPNYIRNFDDARLQAVVDRVHDWLYGGEE